VVAVTVDMGCVVVQIGFAIDVAFRAIAATFDDVIV
jgi:hypothetical protein